MDARIIWYFKTFYWKLFFKEIGRKSYIGKPLFLYGTKKITIRNKVRIFPMSRFEVHGKDSEVIIEDDVSIGQNFHIISGGKLIIGSRTTIASNVFVNNMDNDYQEIDVSIMKQKQTVLETRIGENCFIGFGVAIQAGTILGKQCIVGANAVVKGVFPDYCVIAGVPARIIKRYNPDSGKWEKTDKFGNFINSEK